MKGRLVSVGVGRAAPSRCVTLGITVSIDGFVARLDGTVDWLAAGGPGRGWPADVDVVVMGRKTYDAFFAVRAENEPRAAAITVFSRRRPTGRAAGVRFSHTDPAEYVRALRRRDCGGVWIAGGGEIARACLDAGVVDQLVLTIAPVLLGDGRPLFLPRGGTSWMRLLATHDLGDSFLRVTYAVAGRRQVSAPPQEAEPRATPLRFAPAPDNPRLELAAVGA